MRYMGLADNGVNHRIEHLKRPINSELVHPKHTGVMPGGGGEGGAAERLTPLTLVVTPKNILLL